MLPINNLLVLPISTQTIIGQNWISVLYHLIVLLTLFFAFISGVDWKSLTIPASLPITTDYFPDPVSLVNEYVVNEYDLVPEEILSDAAADRSPLDAKNSLPTNEEIFTELISQRLAQGFQLILLTPQVGFDFVYIQFTYYIKSFDLVTLCDLVTVFAETKSVTKSRLHCTISALFDEP